MKETIFFFKDTMPWNLHNRWFLTLSLQIRWQPFMWNLVKASTECFCYAPKKHVFCFSLRAIVNCSRKWKQIIALRTTGIHWRQSKKTVSAMELRLQKSQLAASIGTLRSKTLQTVNERSLKCKKEKNVFELPWKQCALYKFLSTSSCAYQSSQLQIKAGFHFEANPTKALCQFRVLDGFWSNNQTCQFFFFFDLASCCPPSGSFHQVLQFSFRFTVIWGNESSKPFIVKLRAQYASL